MFDGLKTAVVSFGKAAVITAVEKAPIICFVGGTIALGATIYMAVKAAPKVKEDLDEYTAKAKELDEQLKAGEAVDQNGEKVEVEVEENGEEVKTLTKKEYNHEMRSLFVDTTINVVKHMGGAAACALLAVSLFGAAAYIPTLRLAQLSGEYVALDKTFKEYRAVVREEDGVEKDHHYMFKTKEAKRTVKVPSLDEEGNVTDVEVEETHEVGEENPLYWVYSAETCPIFSSSEIINDEILFEKEKNLQRKFERCRILTDNDVLNELGLFGEIKKNPKFGIKFGKKWKKDADNTFKLIIEKIWLPDYTRKSGYALKYQVTYDRELL